MIIIIYPCFQMGTNQCASQSGMNPYGLSRQIYDAREAKRLEEQGTTYGSQFLPNSS